MSRCQPEVTGETMQGLMSALEVASIIITIGKWKTKTQKKRRAEKSGCWIFEMGHLIPEFSHPYLPTMKLRSVTHVPDELELSNDTTRHKGSWTVVMAYSSFYVIL